MRIRGRVVKNFNAGSAIKKYFHIQTVFMILMTCLIARVIYENDRIEYKLEEIHKLLLEGVATGVVYQGSTVRNSESSSDYYNSGTIEPAVNINQNADIMEQAMNRMHAGEERFINGYRVRKLR